MDKSEFLELLKDREVVEVLRKALTYKLTTDNVPTVDSEFRDPGEWVLLASGLLKPLILSDTRFHNRWFKSLEVFNCVVMNKDYAKLDGVLHTGRGLRYLADLGLLRVGSAGKGLMKFRYDSQEAL
jgi:hypothetical protein